MKLSAHHIGFRLGHHTLLRDISVTALPGSITGLAGPNGAGKTTLLKILAGLRRPTTGNISIDGEDLTKMHASERAKLMAYVPQSRIIHWPVSVAMLVAMGRLAHRKSPGSLDKINREIVAEAMVKMQVENLANRNAMSLSGGEQARVLLARALAQQPALLLADEPASALDLRHQIKLMELLRELAQSGLTIIVSLHDLSQIARYCDHVVVLNQGEMIVAGTPLTTLTQKTIADVYGVNTEIPDINGMPVITPLNAGDAP